MRLTYTVVRSYKTELDTGIFKVNPYKEVIQMLKNHPDNSITRNNHVSIPLDILNALYYIHVHTRELYLNLMKRLFL